MIVASTGMDLVISQIVSPRSSLCALICLFSCTRKDHKVDYFGSVMIDDVFKFLKMFNSILSFNSLGPSRCSKVIPPRMQ